MAKGWHGESKRHSEAATMGKARTPLERRQGAKFVPPYHVDVWEERDRLGIWVMDADDKTVTEWWDDDARQMFEDGFFRRGRGLEESVIDYLRDMGVIK